MANQNGDDDYDVGYGKPPKQHQWKKGQSGNPSGKRKREERLKDMFSRIAAEEICVSQNGSQTAMPQGEAAVRAILSKSMKGDVAAFRAIAPFLEKADVQESGSGEYSLEPADLAVLEMHADWEGVVEQARKELQGTNDAADSEEV